MTQTKFTIRNRFTDAVQFECELPADTAGYSVQMGFAVKAAIRSGANLTGANLRGAYLRNADLRNTDLGGADLGGANLVDGGQRSDGYRFVGYIRDGLRIHAGCHDFTIQDAREHWLKTRGGTPLGDETMAILDHIETVARIRGMMK